MRSKALIHKSFLALFLLALAVWGASCTSSTPLQETTQQQKTQQQKSQQETTQQAAQAPPSTTQSSGLAAKIIGTWQATSLQGNPVPQGTTQVLTFSDDGTLQVTSNVGSQQANRTTQYSVLDDSHVQVAAPDGTSYVLTYDSNEDTLTGTVSGATVTYQRRTG